MSALDRTSAPYGPDAPATDFIVVSAPASDVELETPGRAFYVLGNGTVAVTTENGNDRTVTLTAGATIACAITHVLSETTADLLVYLR